MAADAWVPLPEPDDASVVAPDAPPFDCASCAPPDPCDELVCAGACEYRPLADGTACGDGVCVTSVCEERRCGDGWRERGAGLAREACDDHNTIPGDGCSELCEPEAVVVGSNPGGFRDWMTGGRGGAVTDDDGNLLVVWTRERPEGADASDVLARRYDRFGTVIDAVPLQLDRALVGDRPAPTAVGLTSGWAVAWSSRTIEGSDGFIDGVAAAIIPPVGAPGAAFQVNTMEAGTQRRASMVRIASGLVIAWEHQSLEPIDVHARLFDARGTARSAELNVAVGAHAEARPSLIALDGDEWIAGWIDADATFSVRARRFNGSIASPAFAILEASVDELALARSSAGLVVGVRDIADSGTIGAGDFTLGAPKSVPAVLTWMGSSRDERDVAVAALDPGWMALYRSAAIGSDRAVIAVSPGATPPPELDRLRVALRDALDVEHFSITPSNDGWVIAWTARSFASLYEIRLFRLAP